MKRDKKNLILFLFLVLAAGCDGDNLFYGNAFQGVDKPMVPGDLSDESAESLIDLANDWGDHFYDSIDNGAEFLAVTTTLNDVLTDPSSSTGERQDAAIVLANVYLYDSGANESLNQATQNVSEIQDINLSDPVALSDYMFGADATAEEIAPQLLGMYASFNALTAYGNTLETHDPPVGADTNLLGMQALTAAIMTTIVNDVMVDLGLSQTDAAQMVAAYLADGGVCPWNVDLSFLNAYTDATTDAAMEVDLALPAHFNSPGIANTIMGGSTIADLLRQ